MSELFRLQNVHVGYGQKAVIRDVSLAVHRGEFCALLGLNGSGKTTILHAACGFIPMSGTCTVNGQNCAGLHEKQRARLISFISQVSSLTGGRSVLDVVMMGFNAHLGLLEFPGSEHRRTAEDMLNRLGLLPLKDEDFGTLSQGQKQMVILSRCMVQDAPMMLMDEPDSALDFLNRHKVLGKIRDMIHTDGRGGLITLHDPNFAMAYCDRIFLLKNGVLSGELVMKDAGADEIRQKLSDIYGQVDILPHAGSYIMWRAEQGLPSLP